APLAAAHPAQPPAATAATSSPGVPLSPGPPARGRRAERISHRRERGPGSRGPTPSGKYEYDLPIKESSMLTLSERSAPVVRATLPVVGAAIEDITDLFYRRMFAARPELLRDLFNRGNQASGEQRRALAGSIAAFATALVEHPGQPPEQMLSRIAHKHASLGVTSEQYKIV